jgi:hypothetical protein
MFLVYYKSSNDNRTPVGVLLLSFRDVFFASVKGSRCRRLKVCELNAVYSKAEEEEEGNLEYMLTVSLI